jgi:hypothetical protein
VLVDLEILGKPVEDRVDDLADDARIATFRHDQDELVAAEPEHLDFRPFLGGLDEALPDLDQELIANGVAERIVDILEAVEIEQCDRDRALGALAGQQAAEHFLQR